jgi:UDP-N-acetylglucosamine--N-acetylmuramyl-(pentapeptide) pyrophosphoryl-undecaprenol N-acetylglucosamine transferase
LTQTPPRLLIAASGTGGHLFPAIATAAQLPDYHIEWLGVPNRMETELIPPLYPLHTIAVSGFQKRFSLDSLRVIGGLVKSIWQVRQILKEGSFQVIFTTGGYIAAPVIVAAKMLGIPVILHEANALPGKVTRWLTPWCRAVAIGFAGASQHLKRRKTIFTGTPVRSQFLTPQPLDLPIPENVPLIVAMGGSQGAVTLNKLVRECASAWLKKGAWVVHLTGNNDPDFASFKHPQYIAMPFYNNMAGLLQRANLAISRSGASALTELAVTKTPALLIPYPFAAEDHQSFNATVFTSVGAGLSFRQSELTADLLQSKVLHLLTSPDDLVKMGEAGYQVAVIELANLVRKVVRE